MNTHAPQSPSQLRSETKTQRTGGTALILGITGGYGGAMARALAADGYALKAVVRDVTRAEAACTRLGVTAELIVGDVLDRDALIDAAQHCKVIVHGVNAPYHKWDPFVVDAARCIADAASNVGATILFPGNIYAWAAGTTFSEDTPTAPPTHKGELREEVEAILRAATTQGAGLIVLRGGDFFGSGGESSWMTAVLKRVDAGGAIFYPADFDLPHQWAFLPDYAATHVALLRAQQPMGGTSVFNFGGHMFTGHDLHRAVVAATPGTTPRLRRFPWWLLKLISPFTAMMRALLEMRYLWDRPVMMDDRRLHGALERVPATPLNEAVAHTLAAMRA